MGVGVSEEEEERWRGEGGGKENINEKKKITGACSYSSLFCLICPLVILLKYINSYPSCT